MRDLHWTLDSLPPHLRAQAERQLGNTPTSSPNRLDATASSVVSSSPSLAPSKSKVFAIPNSTPPNGAQNAPRRRGGVFKANTLFASKNEPQALPEPSPAGFMSIAEMRAEKKASRKRKYLTPDMANTLVKSCETSPDGTEVRIVLGVDPYMVPTAQQKGAFVGKDNRVHFFTKAKVAKSEKALIKALSPLAHHFEGWGNAPRMLLMDFCFPFPKSTPKKEMVHYTYHSERPDLDNMCKGVLDSLTQSKFWEDDNVISELHLRKFRVLTDPKVVITVRKLHKVAAGADMFNGKKEFFFKEEVGSEFSNTKETL